MRKKIALFVCFALICALWFPAAHAEEASLVECVITSGKQIYIRLAENVTGAGEDFYVEGVVKKDLPHVTVDPSDVRIFQRERTEIVLDFSSEDVRDRNLAVSASSILLHDMLLSDGTHVDIPLDKDALSGTVFPLRFYKKWTKDEKNLLYFENQNIYEDEYSVVVGTVWTLEEPEDGYSDAYLHAHAEISVEGVSPQIEDDTVTFNTTGECVITFRCCGDFAVQKTIVHVLTKSEIKRELIIPTLLEGFLYGMGIGYWLGPWWLPLSIPGGIVYGIVKVFRILFA